MFRLIITTAFVSLVGAFFLNATRPALAQEKDKPVTIVSPKDNEKMAQIAEVEGKLNGPGWPVILVQPQVGERLWWIQPLVEELEDGKFTVQAQFGNDQTELGTKFKVIIVVAKSKEDAKKFEPGKTRTALPPGLPRSQAVTITRGE